MLALWAVLLGLGWPAVASAGPEINIPRAEDGPGIKAGERSTFHPGFALVSGIDSNVFTTARGEVRPASGEVGPRLASFVMPTGWMGIGNRQFRDGLLMSPPERSGRAVDYYFGAVAGFRYYTARNVNVRGQSRLSGGLQTRLAFLPGRKFSINADGDLFRYAQPSTYETAAFNFNRIDGRFQLSFIGRPGGGRLSVLVGPRIQGLRFENTDRDIARGNRIAPGFTTEAKWRIRPKSAFVVNYGFDWTYYTACCLDLGLGRNEDNYAHRITGGFRGQIMKKVVLDAMGGYGLAFYRADPNGPDFRGPIVDLGVTYYPNPRSLIYLSFYRSFQDSLLGNYYTDVGARLQARHEFKWRMIATAGTWVAARRYSGLPVEVNDFEISTVDRYEGRGTEGYQRNDVVFNLNAKVEQPLGKIWAVALQYDVAVDSTDFIVFYDNGVADVGGFSRHVLMILGAVRI